ncbi:LysR family transcriptional regulator [Sphingomonas xanthus]|uniref:LysR family transcriptional regulator n=1 Tax=Sphingomonas xanthus TaxID=2594473 RepID=A0A516INT2_9SPHN|nr:LysR family transcriptional regulator [Sphingomonas xanthus]QDP18539.1 LysR family transcriptional regulator [Sphingomonas xanthus]
MRKGLAWDDLLTVLAIGRNGSLAGAAREMRVNHSTMFRRISGIEERLGVRLFERLRSGYIPTVSGEAVISLAERIDAEVVELERKLAGKDLRLSGTVRLTTTDTLLPWIMSICASFERLNPEVAIELVTGGQMLNLSRRDADIAIRPAAAPSENLYGRRIGKLSYAIYGSGEYLQRKERDLPLTDQDWIGLDDSLSHLRAYRWLGANIPSANFRLYVNSLTALRHAAEAGIGLALLPCYMAAASSGLRRVSPVVAEAASELWILVHEDIRAVARVKAFTDFAFEKLAELRDMFDPATSDASD